MRHTLGQNAAFRRPAETTRPMTRIGYARCWTDKQDLETQRAALLELGVPEDRIYTEYGLTGINGERPGLAQAWRRPKMATGSSCRS